MSCNASLDQIVFSSHNLECYMLIDQHHYWKRPVAKAAAEARQGFFIQMGKTFKLQAPGSQVFDVVHCSNWIPDSLPAEGTLWLSITGNFRTVYGGRNNSSIRQSW
ncbi:MAG: hypothetical protein IPI04_15880 [Ignavibacteria bacterium]|nr:hypothetical protein [Ignavibacteria bacterium]